MLDRRRPPHLLYVAWSFPPSRSGGVYRALATANGFARAGWRVTVLTAERAAFERYTGVDVGLERHVDERVRVVRLPFRWPQLDTDIRGYPRLRVHAPQRWQERQLRRETAVFPEPGYGSWRPVLERAAIEIHRQDPVDLVVATANPNVDFTAAWALNRRFAVPYVMDYRDAWLLDVFEGGLLHAEHSSAARWERRLVGAAQEVWFVNEQIRDWHRRRYPSAAERMHVVANGFDAGFIPPPRRPGSDAHGGLTFGYLGTISLKVPLAELIEAWRLARERDRLLAGSRMHLHGYLGYYAAPRADLAKRLADAQVDAVRYAGPVSKTEVGGVYGSFDVLLLALGSGRYVTSGKVYEYLATGLPIVSVHDPGNAASDVLRGYPLWFPVDHLDAEAVAEALCRAGQAALNGDPGVRRRCLDHAAGYSRERQLAPRVAALTQWSGAPGPPGPPARPARATRPVLPVRTPWRARPVEQLR